MERTEIVISSGSGSVFRWRFILSVLVFLNFALWFIVIAQPARSDTYYVIPLHPSASDGNNYYCTVRLSCSHEDLIAQGFGTINQPFGSISEAVFQADVEGPPGSHTIYVAPGIYREHVFMAGRTDIILIADTSGVYTGTAPGEVIVTGTEPIDESQFIPHETLDSVYVCYDVTYSDGTSLCPTLEERCGTVCWVSMIVETNNQDTYRTTYTKVTTVSDVALGNGRFYYEVDETDPDDPILALYIRTFNGTAPTEDLGLELLLWQACGNYKYDFFYKHKHCFDLEAGAVGNTIQGFTCRYTTMSTINIAYGNNTIQNNRVYGFWSDGINAWATPSEAAHGPIKIVGNEVSHSVTSHGIVINHADNNVYVENNVVHNNKYFGILVDLGRFSSFGTPTVFIGNNTVYGNKINLWSTAGEDVNLIVVNNTFSHSIEENYYVASSGNSVFSFNNWYGGAGYGTNYYPETNLLNVDPMFVDPVVFDFHLAQGSELIGAGVDTSVAGYLPPAFDKDGKPRSDAYEIGAYEYSELVPIGESMGDVNDDGEVNILDVLAVAYHTLGTVLLNDSYLWRADCNRDGVGNILDALALVNVILGMGRCAPGECKSEVTDETWEFLKLLEPYLQAEDFAEFMTLVEAEMRKVPIIYDLAQNYPNPFNTETSIRYSIASGQSPSYVTLKIYNPLGQKMRTLVDGIRDPGDYLVTWDGKDGNGREAASGVYFYRLTVGGTSRNNQGDITVTKRMVLMK